MDNETMSLSTLEIPGRVPVNNDSASWYRPMMPENEDTPVMLGEKCIHAGNVHNSQKKMLRRGNRSSFRAERRQGEGQQYVPMSTKEVAENGAKSTLLKPAVEIPDQIHVDINGLSTANTTSDVMIINRHVPQSEENFKENGKTKSLKSNKLQRRVANSSRSLTKVVRNTARRPSRNLNKSSLRRSKGISVQEPEVIGWSAPLTSNYKELAENKAGNNNWIANTEETSSGQSRLVSPTYRSTSRASSFNTFIQPNSVSKPFTRAASTDDLGDFSVSSIRSSYLQSADKSKRQSPARLFAPRLNDSLIDSKRKLRTNGHCSTCKNESLGRNCTLCKHCANRSRPDELHHGPLDDLKAYAQSIATKVKEILLLSPGSWQSEEIMHNSAPKEENYEAENMKLKSVPDVLRHRHRTEINITRSQEAGPKGLLNKSLSYDGRMGTDVEDKDGRSPLYWINQDNSKVSKSSSKLSHSSVIYNDTDCYVVGKDGKHLIVIDDDRNIKQGGTEKPRPKISIKQLAYVERAKTEGDLRTQTFQPLTGSKKQGKGNRSKTFHKVNADLQENGRCSQKHQENAFNISRLKVIHEGTPVDPPYIIEKKNSEDGKGRKATFLRSAPSLHKKYIQKKEMVNGDNVNTLECGNRSNTITAVRTNKASTLRREISLNDKQKVQEPGRGRWIGENSIIATTSLLKTRSTSYDGIPQGHFKRSGIQKSISLFAIADDDERGAQRNESASAENISIQRENDSCDIFSVQSKLPVQTQEYHARKVLSTNPFLECETSDDIFECREKKTCKELLYENPKDISVTNKDGEHWSPSVNSMMNSGNGVEKQLSPCFEEDVLVADQSDSSFDNYYCYPETPKISNQSDTSLGKNSSWYSGVQGSISNERALMRRDRSLESKSSTSFQLVTTVKSSHSDETLIKWHGYWDHGYSRKQDMYSETDVDTGLIYHLAKRQTTRAHAPQYHDLTNASRDIYTMSGDVNTTACSNSVTSTRSDTNECAYTGGFFTVNQFQENEKMINDYNSKESSSNIYFEPDGKSKLEPSELDIYTGSLFNCNQNTRDPSITHLIIETLKDSSIKKSTRSTVRKVQRRVKCRPCKDAINARSDNSAWEYFSEAFADCDEYHLSNISNNSSNWCGIDEFEGSFNQGSIVTKSKDPLYTDYDPGTRPEFHVNAVEKTVPVFDFLKYESPDETRNQCASPKNEISGGAWYSGLLHGQNNDYPEKPVKGPDQSPEGCIFSWQHYDDYYTSTVRPRVKRANRCNIDTPRNSWNVNNNHFDDIYTGSYGAQNVQTRVPEQTNNNRQPATENWYVKQPTPMHNPSTFYEQYDSLYASPSTTRIPPAPNKSPKISHSSTSAFGRESSAYSESSSYMPDNGWRNYEPIQKPSTKSFEEPQRKRSSPERHSSDDTESYFQYVVNKSPGKSFYITDEDTYSFEQKVVKEKSPETPIIPEVKTVGGIVCRENVANKEDYAEDINRDLEPGPWIPFTLRREDEGRYPLELGQDRPEVPRAVEASFGQAQGIKYLEDSSYAHNRVYDNLGARNKWREMATKKDSETSRSRESSQNRSYQSGDTGKQDHGKSKKNLSDIPGRTKGKRSSSNAPKSASIECSGVNKSSGTTSFKYKRH